MKPMVKGVMKEFPRCPAGQFIGRLVGIIDEGTQNTVYKGVSKQKPLVYLQYEMYAEDEEGRYINDDMGNPFIVGIEFPAILTEKSNLFKWIGSWRGKELEDSDFPFDFNKILGKYGLISIVRNVDKNDPSRTYANMSGIAPVPKRLSVNLEGKNILPDGVSTPFFFDMDNPDWLAMFSLYNSRIWEKMQNKIALSPEFKIRSSGKMIEDEPSNETYSVEDILF